jgi:RNA polymerase sigma factor (TIGR02999 family)
MDRSLQTSPDPSAEPGPPGPTEALDELFPVVYRELRELAHRHRERWSGNATLNTTALVHEAYIKLASPGKRCWDGEAHFLATAGRAIRQILINYARAQDTQKRGGAWHRVALSEEILLPEDQSRTNGLQWKETLLALNKSLERLEARNERHARIVECRFFAGMTIQQTADGLGVSVPTVTRAWALARAWLHRDLRQRLDRPDP